MVLSMSKSTTVYMKPGTDLLFDEGYGSGHKGMMRSLAM